jgi:hypothetical protein
MRMRFSKYLIGLVTTISLVACGGGGGSAGTTASGNAGLGGGSATTPGTTTPSLPTLTLALIDSTGAATKSVSASGLVSAKATVKDATGTIVVGAKVTFVGDAVLIKISPASSVLTDTSGVATVQISAANLSAAGAGTLSASALVAGTTLSFNIDFQLSPANLTLTALDVGAALGSLAAYGNRPISVVANINGVAATSTPVQVSFTAACGTVNPATATTDSNGKAATTYTADNANCAGANVKITATSVGVASPLEATISVAAVQATNLQFVGASPTLIYLLGSGANTQSLVTFKVVDSTGNPVQNQKVNLALLNAAPAAGLSIDALGQNAGVAKTSDASGQVTVAVFSGNVPTSVQITAKLDAPSTVQSNSNFLTVASGKPVQRAVSLALEKFSIEGFDNDGITSSVTFSMADRQGNPVPDGTEVNLVAEAGVLIPARCVVAGGTSQCASSYRSSGTRPANGRVSILAFVPGEEDFVDANFNNQYDPGETFTDMGNVYRDDNEDGLFTVGEFSVPRAGTGCVGSPGENGRPGTCDGVWGANEVRKQAIIVLATGRAVITSLSTSASDFRVSVTDLNGNGMPTGTTIAAEKVSGRDACTVKKVFPAIIANRYGPQDVSIELDKCASGTPASAGPPPVAALPADSISVTVTSPLGIVTFVKFALTP